MKKRQKSYKQMLKEGYGQGREEHYKPWGTHRFASEGQTSRPSIGLHFNRPYLFYSRLEQRVFHLFDFRDDILEIREQFPLLPREETFIIANDLGIRHPQDTETGEIYVRTIDFLINYSDGREVAFQVKENEDFSKRTEEKFEIERVYLARRDIKHLIITEEEVDEIKADNIADMKQFYDLKKFRTFRSMDEQEILHYIALLYVRVIDSSSKLCDITNQYDSDLGFPEGTGLTVFKHLVIRKILEIDLSKELFSANKVIKVVSARDLF